MNIGHAIRYLRKRKGWTQQQLADFSNTSKSNISNLENCNQGYSPAILQYLAKAFNYTVAQLFLLAESFDDDESIAENWDQIPIDGLFIPLPKDIQDNLKQFIHSLIKNKS